MFKPTCGRKQENPVWHYFDYDKSSDKSRCKVGCDSDSASDTGAAATNNAAELQPAGASGSEKQRSCGQELIGKNTTNLKNHLRSKHKEIYEKVVAEESVKREPHDDRPSRQTTLNVKVHNILYLIYVFVICEICLLFSLMMTNDYVCLFRYYK
jgi:hypothetical protein